MVGKKDYSTAFGAVIKIERLKQNMSQEELAFRCQLDRTYISSIERGVKNCTLHTAWLLAKGLNVKLADLIYSTDRILEQ